MEMTFEEWLKQIDALALKRGAVDEGKSYTDMTGHECWREMYDDEMTPEDAWGEEEWAAVSMIG